MMWSTSLPSGKQLAIFESALRTNSQSMHAVQSVPCVACEKYPDVVLIMKSLRRDLNNPPASLRKKVKLPM